MASTYTPSLTLTQIGNGEQSGTWGTTTNTNWQLIEDAVAGVAQVSVSGTSGATLSVANGTTDQARKAIVVVTGSTSGTNAIVAPLQPKVYIISNQTTGGFNITIGASSGSVVTIPNGVTTLVYCDGTNFYSGITGFTGGNLSISGNITATGTITGATFATAGGVPQMAGGVANQIPYQTNTNATGYIAAPGSDTTRFLSYVPGTGFQWQTSSTTASSLNGGTANSLVYQSSPGTTAFLANPGTSTTYFLTYNNGLSWTTGGSVASVTASSPIGITGTSTNPNVTLNGIVPIANGGTGATSFASAGLATTSSLSSYALLSGASFTGAVTSTGTISTGTQNSNYSALQLGAIALYNASTGMYHDGSKFGFQGNGTTMCFIYNGTGTIQNISGLYQAVSDERIKENITPARSYLADLQKLNVVNYNLKGRTDKYLGLVAQDVQKVIPGLVSEEEKNDAFPDVPNLLSVKYSILVPMLLQAVQELKSEVDSLKAQVTAK